MASGVVELSHSLVSPAKVSHWFQPLPPKHPRTCPRIIRTAGGDHLYFGYANCAMTHGSGTSDHVNRSANMNHACSSGVL
jgi:hypothetical protein